MKYLYVDGTLDVSSPATGSITQTSNPLCIGDSPDHTERWLNGLVDETSLYNRALTATEIQSIYNAGSDGKYFEPVPPGITSQPANQTVFVGQSATFSTAAAGTSPLSYQWNFNGNAITNATNATLTLTNVQLNQAGNYSVLVINPYGSTNSSPAALTVNPVICTPPPSGLVGWWRAEGDATDAFGACSGIAQNVTYSSGEVGQSFNFAGSSSSYVRIPASSSIDVGQGNGFTIELWCNPTTTNNNGLPLTLVEWNNNSGALTGIGCHLEFYDGGRILGDIVDPNTGNDHYVMSQGGNVTPGVWQHVAMTYDKTTGTLALFQNGNMVASNNVGIWRPSTGFDLYFGIRSAGVFAPIPFRGSMDEIALYDRVLSPAEIQSIYDSGSAGKCVSIPPRITSQPTSQTNILGSAAMFNVMAAGTQPLCYQWRFNGNPIAGATNATLTLTNLHLNQAGSYQVALSNLFGKVTSSNATLSVLAQTILTYDYTGTEKITAAGHEYVYNYTGRLYFNLSGSNGVFIGWANLGGLKQYWVSPFTNYLMTSVQGSNGRVYTLLGKAGEDVDAQGRPGIWSYFHKGLNTTLYTDWITRISFPAAFDCTITKVYPDTATGSMVLREATSTYKYSQQSTVSSSSAGATVWDLISVDEKNLVKQGYLKQ
jgi:hypothetical protein